ncbi:MAG: D-sedoheptulose 7-phosphate isomerase [Nanoarchaeota archaeon]|nr:D-sedoheptulose 7-phosphate isomerase [Nanoarchaeota archaeon]
MDESMRVKQLVLKDLIPDIEKAVEMIIDCFEKGGKLLICGNGGSAADASHFAGEFVARFLKERKALPAIALNTDTSIITAWSNDYSFDTVFERQVEALGRKGDIFIGISTSSNSPNIIKASEYCRKAGIKTLNILGNDGGKLKALSDHSILVMDKSTPRIQESHIMIAHIICELVEKHFAEG